MSERRATMRRRTWRLGLVAVSAAGAGLTIVAPASSALPPGTPRTGMVCNNGSLSGSTRTFNLVANSGHIQTPDGNSVLMWSYSVDGDPNYPVFQSPGPVLCANQNETVQVQLRNTLSTATSIVFPGQDSEVTAAGGSTGLFTTEAAASGGTVSYS